MIGKFILHTGWATLLAHTMYVVYENMEFDVAIFIYGRKFRNYLSPRFFFCVKQLLDMCMMKDMIGFFSPHSASNQNLSLNFFFQF